MKVIYNCNRRFAHDHRFYCIAVACAWLQDLFFGQQEYDRRSRVEQARMTNRLFLMVMFLVIGVAAWWRHGA